MKLSCTMLKSDKKYIPSCKKEKNMSRLTIAEVRKTLAYMRVEWSKHQYDHPIDIYAPIPKLSNHDMADFAVGYVLQHHRKRTCTSTSTTTTTTRSSRRTTS